MEGKYWKRRMQSVTTEYQKWRKFYKDHFTLGSNEQLHVQDVSPKSSAFASAWMIPC